MTTTLSTLLQGLISTWPPEAQRRVALYDLRAYWKTTPLAEIATPTALDGQGRLTIDTTQPHMRTEIMMKGRLHARILDEARAHCRIPVTDLIITWNGRYA
jgi:hypothetical protein